MEDLRVYRFRAEWYGCDVFESSVDAHNYNEALGRFAIRCYEICKAIPSSYKLLYVRSFEDESPF